MPGDDPSPSERALPLTGLRVIDLTTSWGELSSRLLGDLGAVVIKVEQPGGSPSRAHAPVRAGVSLSWAYRNAGKLGIVLDRSDDDDRDRFQQLLASADVVVTNDPADADLADHHPTLVVAVISSYGMTGPYAGRAATDAVIAATAGQAFKAGLPEREPLPPPGRFCDDIAAATGAFAILCALRQRESTGAGDVIDFSVNEAVAQMSDWSMPNGMARLRAGIVGGESRKGSGPVYPVFRCMDGYVRLIILSPRQWHAMRAWIGEPDYLQDPSFDGFVARFEIADAVLNPLYEEHFSTMRMEEVSAEAQHRGIVCTPVLPPAGVLANEHLRARGTFQRQSVAPGVEAEVHAGFLEVDGRRAGPTVPAPTLDHDRERVLATLPPSAVAGAAPSAVEARPPLGGLRVLDFGHGAVGVEIGRMFAEQGADVIKVESSTYPDFIRLQTGGTNTPSFTSSSRSKRSFGVNAKSAKGRDMLLDLARQSDLVIENNASGVMDDLGLGYSAMRAANPDIVMASSQLMGSRGPWAHWRGYGPSTLAPSGVLRLWDYPDADAPTGGGTIFPDQFVGRLGAVAALAAIVGRERSAVVGGAHLELAQVEAAAGIVADLLSAESVAPSSVGPLGDGHESAAPWGMFPCAGTDQWVAINCRDDADWRGLVAAMGASDADAMLDLPARRAQAVELKARIVEWTHGLDKHEVAARCQAHGVPAGAMLTGVELASDPHLVARGFPVEVQQPELGTMTLEGPAFRSRHMPPPRITAAPGLTEHTKEIGAELLGLTAADIDGLLEAGILEWAPNEPIDA
jgi:crotonobetainyl-CoA:carnitine CoA-transferase CaiB-like acyl-CoA transferase